MKVYRIIDKSSGKRLRMQYRYAPIDVQDGYIHLEFLRFGIGNSQQSIFPKRTKYWWYWFLNRNALVLHSSGRYVDISAVKHGLSAREPDECLAEKMMFRR